MKNVDINSCSYYSSSTFNKIFENSGIDASDSLNALHMNIRGLEAHFNDFLAYLCIFPIHFDIICLTEAHLSRNNIYLDSDRFDLDGHIKFTVQ